MKTVVPSLLLMVAVFTSSLAAPPSTPVTDQSTAQKFRLIFKSYDGSPDKPEKMSFQLDTLDLRQPTMFVKIGERIPKTQLKLVSFIEKEVNHPNGGDRVNVSELTVRNIETGESAVMVLRKVTNIPNSAK
jgi:hypothetical protein